MEYTRQRTVIDGVNVDGEVYRIRTTISEGGSSVEAATWVARRDRKTRQQRLELLDEDFVYSAQQLDRAVVAVDQIRTLIRTFRERLFTELFPGRSEVPNDQPGRAARGGLQRRRDGEGARGGRVLPAVLRRA
jgi:type I restriction enzyme R subunit